MGIDALRFLAAMMVVAFHFAFTTGANTNGLAQPASQGVVSFPGLLLRFWHSMFFLINLNRFKWIRALAITIGVVISAFWLIAKHIEPPLQALTKKILLMMQVRWRSLRILN